MFPSASTATPEGRLNWALPSPGLPNDVTNVPSLVNFWIRSLRQSATYTWPSAAHSPHGRLNCPSPLPFSPHWARYPPSAVNFWMRWLFWSAMYMLSSASMAIPAGPFSSPSPLPIAPHLAAKAPEESKIEMRWRYSSVTYSRSLLSNAIATGSPNCPSPVPKPLPNSPLYSSSRVQMPTRMAVARAGSQRFSTKMRPSRLTATSYGLAKPRPLSPLFTMPIVLRYAIDTPCITPCELTPQSPPVKNGRAESRARPYSAFTPAGIPGSRR